MSVGDGRHADAPGTGDGEDARTRLLKVVTIFACGGTERQFVNLGLGLDPARFDLRFACLQRQGQLLEEILARDLTVREYPMRTFYSARACWQQARLARHIRRDRIDIVHSYNFHSNLFALPAARLAGAPVALASVRDEGVHLTERQRRVHRRVLRLADRVLVNADAVGRGLVEQGLDPARIVLIRNGLDVGRFQRLPSPTLREELGIPPRAPLVGLISRLAPVKGVEHLLSAAQIVLASHPDTRFLIVGEGHVDEDGRSPYADALVARMRRLGLSHRVRFTGYRPDVPDVLADLQIGVLPSLSEGLSNFVIEAMASGVPIVATNVGGTPELVADGETGLLVPPADPRAMADAIVHLLNAPARAAALGAAGRRVAIEHFSMARLIRTTDALYQELLIRHKRTAGNRRRRRSSAVPAQTASGGRP